MWDVLWCCEMLSFVVDLFHNGQQLSATWSATTDIIQIQGILREEDESDLIWLFFWLCPHLRGYGMNFARWYSSLDLMNILCYNIQDSISLGYSSGSIECEGWRQHSWKRLINNVSEVCLVWYSQPLTSIFSLVNSSFKKMRMECRLHPSHSMGHIVSSKIPHVHCLSFY